MKQWDELPRISQADATSSGEDVLRLDALPRISCERQRNELPRISCERQWNALPRITGTISTRR